MPVLVLLCVSSVFVFCVLWGDNSSSSVWSAGASFMLDGAVEATAVATLLLWRGGEAHARLMRVLFVQAFGGDSVALGCQNFSDRVVDQKCRYF